MKKIKNTVFFFTSSLLVHEPNFADDHFFADDLPVVISASRLNQSVLTSPTSVSVIDKAIIEASGFIEFADLLRLVPGFQVAHIDGRRYSVVYHGNGSEISNRIQVLVNGRSTYTPTLSTVNWDSLGLQIEDIEKIEVVRGTAASAYGSNSFTAAINIITKSPELDDHLNLQHRAGNKGERNLILRHSDSIGNLHYRVTGAHRRSKGFDNFSDAKEFNHIGLHGRLYHTENSPTNIYLAYTDGETETRENAEQLLERDRDVTSWSAHIQGGKIFSSTEEIKWNLYHNEDDIYDLSQTLLLSELFMTTPAIFEMVTGNPDTRTTEGSETNDSSKSDFEVIYSSSKNESLQYASGLGIRYDTLKSPSYFREQGRLSDITYRAFTNIQSPITPNLIFSGGAIYEHIESYGGKTSPRASINWEFTDSQSLRLSAAIGYRFPSILDKNFDTRTTLPNGFILDERFNYDENLKPEKIKSFDLAYLGQLTRLPINWDIKIYEEKITDIISFAEVEETSLLFDDESRLITNGGEITNYGIEGELNYRPSNNSFVKLVFNLGRSKYKALERINPDAFEESEKSTPRNTSGIISGINFKGWQFNAGLYYLGSMDWYSQGNEIDSYTRIDTSVSKSFKIQGKHSLKVKLARQNIGEKHSEFGNEDRSGNPLLFEPRYYLNIEYKVP